MSLKEFFCDGEKLSTSRFGLFLMNLVGAGIAVYLAYLGQGLHAAAIVTGIAGTDATVYALSTRKEK